MIRRPPRSTRVRSSAASDVYKRQDLGNLIKAAKMGSWIGLDGLNEDNVEDYVRKVKNMKENNLLNKVLLSHDAGWYHPGEQNGGEYRGYTTLFEKLIPLLR